MADKTVMDMFADMAKQINLPKIDYEAFVDIHRKNIDAMQKSAAVASSFLRRAALFSTSSSCVGASGVSSGTREQNPSARSFECFVSISRSFAL